MEPESKTVSNEEIQDQVKDIDLVNETFPQPPIADAMEQRSLLSIIEKVVMSPDVDIDKMEKLLDLQERIIDKQSAQVFAQAMAACQGEMPSIIKEGYNDQTESTYAKFENIIEVTKPIYTKHGFAVSFGNGVTDLEKHIRITCAVSHSGGHIQEYIKDIPIDDVGIKGSTNKTQLHAKASSDTYGKRYLFTGIFNIAVTDNDNDGNTEQPVISNFQVKELIDLIDDTDADIVSFCTYLKVGSIEELWESNFEYAKKLLTDRKVNKDASN